jgi:hypothetical protein
MLFGVRGGKVAATKCGSPFLVLDLGLYIIDGVGRLDLEGDSLASQSLNEDLHAVC